MTAILTLSGVGYDYLFMGTKKKKQIRLTAPPGFLLLQMQQANTHIRYLFTALDTGIAVAGHSKSHNLWYDRIPTFNSGTLEKIADLNVQEDPSNPEQENKDNNSDPNKKKDDKKKNNKKDKNKKDKKDKNKKNNKVQTPGKDVDKESKYESDLSGGTSKVDSSTGLKDGSYVPDKFSWLQVATGKVQISCSKVSITGGQAYATITFSSDAYGYVKANGNMYYPDHSGGGSTFVIPVALNKNNSIIGMTTRMSVPHEIQYSIFVYLNGADNKSDKDGENPSSSDSMVSTGNKKLDDKAPEITGLEYKDENLLWNMQNT